MIAALNPCADTGNKERGLTEREEREVIVALMIVRRV